MSTDIRFNKKKVNHFQGTTTWIFFLFHVGVKHFFRSFISFLRSFISFLRGIFYSPRGYFKISTWISLFPDTAPYRYVSNHKLLLRPNLHSEGVHRCTAKRVTRCSDARLVSSRRVSVPTASLSPHDTRPPLCLCPPRHPSPTVSCRDARSVRPLSDESYSIVALSGTDAQTERPYSSRFGESVVSKVTASSHYTSRLVRGRTLGRASRQVVTRLIPPIPPMALANSQRPTANS